MTEDEARTLRIVKREAAQALLERIDERTLNTLGQLELLTGTQQTLGALIADHAKELRSLGKQQAATRREVRWFTATHVAAYAVVSGSAFIAALSFAALVGRRFGWW